MYEKYGKDSFIEAEKESLRQDFKGVLSLAGSAVYYDEEMQALKVGYDIIWLDVEYTSYCTNMKNAESKTRPII